MFLALDIETMADAARVANMPEPEVKLGNLVDPAKIKAKKDEAKAKQIEDAAKYPVCGRIICCGLYSDPPSSRYDECPIIPEPTDANEIKLLQYIFGIIADPEVRLITYNGNHFDLPYIYRRAMILGVSPKHFGAPPLTAWTKRYGNDRHIDMQTVWAGSEQLGDADPLELVAMALLGERKSPHDFAKFPEQMQTEAGRAEIAAYCLHDVKLTYRIFERAQGTLFA